MIYRNGIYRPGPALPDLCPVVRTYSDAVRVAIEYADVLDAIEERTDGIAVRLEGVPCPELGDLRDRVEPTMPDKLVDMNTRLMLGGFNINPETGKGNGLSPFWIKTLARIYFTRKLGAKRREIFVRGGRRSGKSVTMCLVALYEALHGDYTLTLDTSTFMFLSAQKQQALERINTIKGMCVALGYDKKKVDGRANEVRFPELRRQIAAFAATAQAVVGYTCFGVICDEMALWGNTDAGADADTAKPEVVLEQLKPTRATHRNAWLIGISAPWSTLDLHYRSIERGTDEHQIVFHCPTWVGNTIISEQQTHDDERDEIKWKRQYAAIPLESDEQKFLPKSFVDAAFKGGLPCEPGPVQIKAGADLGFVRNSSALCVLERNGRKFKLKFEREWIPLDKPLRSRIVIDELVAGARKRGAETVCADIHYISDLAGQLEDTGVELMQYAVKPEDQSRAWFAVKALLQEGLLDLSLGSDRLKEQLYEITFSPAPGGYFSIQHPEVGGAHGDVAQSLVHAVYAFGIEELEGSLASGTRRFVREEQVKATMSTTSQEYVDSDPDRGEH